MIFIFSLLYSEDQFTKKEFDECSGPNTLRDKDGNCTCLPNFPFGDPYSKQGCYICVEQCNERAICVFPGKCSCVNGLVGDGKKSCEYPIPKLVSVDPAKVQKNSAAEIDVKYAISTNFSAVYGYCKIGSTYSLAIRVSDNTFTCKFLPTDIPIQRISISFDNKTWTEEQFYIQLLGADDYESFTIVWQVWIFVILIAAGIYYYFKSRKTPEQTANFTAEERQVFTSTRKDPIMNHLGMETENVEL